MNRSFLSAFFLCCFAFTTVAQNPYKISWKQESAWLGGSGVGIGVSYVLHAHNPAFTSAEVENLQLSAVPRFERFVTRQYSLPARKASDILLFSAVASPLLLMLDKDIRHDAPTAVLLVGETLVLNLAVTGLFKEIVKRPRPYCYNPEVPLSEKLQRDARKSFFSGHTSTSAAATFSAAQIWSDYHPDSSWKPVVWVAAAAIPATVGFLRVKGGKHYLTDVVAGFVVGGTCGILVPRLHRRLNH